MKWGSDIGSNAWTQELWSPLSSSVHTAHDRCNVDVDGLNGVMYTLRLVSEFREHVAMAKP